jgi:hypothetical protein
VYTSGRGAPLPALRMTTVRHPYQQDEATMLMRGWRRRCSGRSSGKARGARRRRRSPRGWEGRRGGGDGEEADARSMGIRSPGGRGRSGRKSPAFGGPTAWREGEGVGGFSGGRRRRKISWGRGRGCRERRRLGRMTAVVGEEDMTTTMAADRGRKMAKC